LAELRAQLAASTGRR